MTRIQDLWSEHIANIKSVCSPQFWEIFLRLHTYSGVAIDTSLSAVRKVFLRKGTDAWNEFPPTRRVLLDKIRSHDSFWNKVWHLQRIDLRAFKLPSRTEYVEFEFIDPLWAWIMAASKQNPWDLHWKPFSQDPTNTTYGGGVQIGKCFREACSSCPPGFCRTVRQLCHSVIITLSHLRIHSVSVTLTTLSHCKTTLSPQLCHSVIITLSHLRIHSVTVTLTTLSHCAARFLSNAFLTPLGRH